MKYIKYLLLPILLVPFLVLAETKNVEIKSISNYVDKSDAAEELEKPNIEGLKLGFKLKFTKQDDFIKYKFIIKNNTDKDYEIDNSSTFNEKKFIRYDYEVENNAKVLKANEELSITVTITYVKALDDSEFENGVFTETNQVSFELINDSNEVIDNPIIKMAANPETSTGSIALIISSIIISLLLILFIRNKRAKLFIIALLLTIPITIYALERIKIDVETYVEIKKYNTNTFTLNIIDCNNVGRIQFIKYEEGMTFEEFINSSYFEGLDLKLKTLIEKRYNKFYFLPKDSTNFSSTYRDALNDPNDDTDDDSVSNENGHKILPSSEGRYQINDCVIT